MTTKTQTREQALAAFLECEPDDLNASKYQDNCFEHGYHEYLVLTDFEADEAASDYIKDSLWTFNASFIASHTRTRLSDKAIAAIQTMQGELCEDANDIIEALISDISHFVKDAISADGRGHFLAQYDSEENELGGYYIYRIK